MTEIYMMMTERNNALDELEKMKIERDAALARAARLEAALRYVQQMMPSEYTSSALGDDCKRMAYAVGYVIKDALADAIAGQWLREQKAAELEKLLNWTFKRINESFGGDKSNKFHIFHIQNQLEIRIAELRGGKRG